MSLWVEPSEPSLQKDVGPGDKTGIYYIPVCNLPFGTTWQELKDFTRTACDVLHVEVFKSSTSGWVQVKGRANFEKAWKLLDGGWFNGRGLIASDRNKDEPIKVKELIDTSPEAWKALSSSTAYLVPDSMAESYGEQFEGLGYTQRSSATYDDYCATTLSYRTTGSGFYSTGNYYKGDYGSAQSGGIPDCQWEASVPYHGSADWSQGGGWDDSASTSNKSEALQSKRREVTVDGLPLSASPGQIDAWVKKTMGKNASKINHIFGPFDDANDSIYGHAFIAFRSSSSAKEALRVLDRSKFKGHMITATIPANGNVEEYEEIDEAQSYKPGRGYDQASSRHSKSKEKKSGHSSTHGSRSGTGSHSSKKSSDRESRKDSSKGKDKDKKHKDRRDHSPLVVDGSSMKRHTKR